MYIASGIGGAIAAMPGGWIGTMLSGAAGNIACEYIKGNICEKEDVLMAGLAGAISNVIGYGVSKKMAKIKANKILSMNRAQKKIYLREKIFKNKPAYANANLNTFIDNPIGTVQKHFRVYQYGIYSTMSSTAFLSVFGGEKR